MGEICALAIVAALCFFLLSELKWHGAPLIALLCFIGILSAARTHLTELGGVAAALAQRTEILDSVSAILRIIGVGYLAGISSDVCAELGVGRIGSAVSLIGRLEMIAIAAPFFLRILDMGTELIG